MGSLYRSKHELVFVFKNGTAPHVNNVELGKHGRNRTNVGLRRSKFVSSRTPRRTCYASHGEAGGPGCRRDPRLLQYAAPSCSIALGEALRP